MSNLGKPHSRPRSKKQKWFVFIQSILGWIKGAGLGTCLLGGLGVMQDPRYFWWSVSLIYLGIILIAIDLHFESWFRSARPIWKVIGTIFPIVILILFSIKFVFISAPLQVGAEFSNAEKVAGTKKADIEWRQEFLELDVWFHY